LDELPDITTVGDFVPGYEATSWQGLGAPRSIPADLIEKLNREVNAVLGDPKMEARIVDLGYTVFVSSPADFGIFIAAYTEKWAKVIKSSGAKM
jgi:tripartite-type tricarboxylate transporter receptor subunit TctC